MKNLLEDFIKKMQYLNEKDVEGIILYGSYQTKTNNSNSDVDMIILHSNSVYKNSKSYKNFNGIEFEIYERNINIIYNRILADYDNGEDTLLSAVGHGEIIFDRNGKLHELQNFALEIYSEKLPKLNFNDVAYYSKSIQKSIMKLKYYAENDCEYFTVYYSIVLEKLRVFYHRMYGFSSLTTASVYKIYTNKKLQKIQYKQMPEEKFIDKYLDCICVSNSLKNESLKNIIDLFKYSTRDLDIDYNNLKIEINDKNH